MIGSLRGTLVDKEGDQVVVEAGGVGYLLSCPGTTVDALGPVGGEVFLYVRTEVREDAITLYGFVDRISRRLFVTLVGVSGIGPRLALAILSHLSPAQVVAAVQGGDSHRLVAVPGIGKKTAQRICLELRDKLADCAEVSLPPAAAAPAPPASSAEADALSALVNLGYSEAVAGAALERLRRETPADTFSGYTFSELVRLALRSLA